MLTDDNGSCICMVKSLYMIHALTIAGRNASGDTYKMGGGLEVSAKKSKNQEPLGR